MRSALLLFAILSLAFAPVPPYRPKANDKTDLSKMQGTWVVTTRRLGDVRREGTSTPGVTAVITGDRLSFMREGKVLTEYTLELNPKGNPKTCDFKRVGGGGNVNTTGTLKAIYKLEGDTVLQRYHASKPFDERPRDFESTVADYMEMTFQRKKP